MYLILLVLLLIPCLSCLDCKPKGSCGCELDDGSYIDLSQMTKFGKPMFKNVGQKGSSSIKFQVDLCKKFDCVTTNDALVCNFPPAGTHTVVVDTLGGFKVTADKTLTFIYTGNLQDSLSTLRVTMHCSHSQGIGTLDDLERTTAIDFTTSLTSQYACWHGGNTGSVKKKGLSTGSILCIILLVFVVVYFVGGVLINRYVRKVEDGSYIPNKDFWTALPSYIKEGCKFSYSKMKRSKEYEQI